MAMLPVRRSGGRNLTVVNPTREFEDIYDRMGQLMNLAFGLAPVDVAEGPWMPLADLSETDDAYVVEVDLPGVNRDQIRHPAPGPGAGHHRRDPRVRAERPPPSPLAPHRPVRVPNLPAR